MSGWLDGIGEIRVLIADQAEVDQREAPREYLPRDLVIENGERGRRHVAAASSGYRASYIVQTAAGSPGFKARSSMAAKSQLNPSATAASFSTAAATED